MRPKRKDHERFGSVYSSSVCSGFLLDVVKKVSAYEREILGESELEKSFGNSRPTHSRKASRRKNKEKNPPKKVD